MTFPMYEPVKAHNSHELGIILSKLEILQGYYLPDANKSNGADMTVTKTTKAPKAPPKLHQFYDYIPLTANKEYFLCGIEYEIECVENPDAVSSMGNLHVTTDGSLKYKGYEFITKPLDVETQLELYNNLMSRLIFDQKVDLSPFNPRTSTHVHVNVQNLTLDELLVLIYLYIIVEPALFSMVKPERFYNIHCVPLHFTCMAKPLKAVTTFSSLHSCWHKYSALNIVPIKKLGTVEFRHMHGMEDIVTLERWLKNLQTLYKAAISGATTKDIITDLYNKQTFTDVVRKYMPEFNLNGCNEQALAVSGVFLKQIVMGKV